jgi:hypothetical protein
MSAEAKKGKKKGDTQDYYVVVLKDALISG